MTVQIDGQFVAVTNQHDVMPIAQRERRLATNDFADAVSCVEKKFSLAGVFRRSSDPEMLAQGAFVSIDSARKQVASNGPGFGWEGVPKPELDAIAAVGIRRVGAKPTSGEMDGPIDG